MTRREGRPFWIACALLLLPLWAAAQEGSAPLPRVVVLPFEVNSAQPIDYLGGSLADLLRSRLESSGQLAVLDAACSP
ncbi:MAG: hypothetical protein ACQGVC_19575, partial [Myxococcota bacterium]